MIIFDRDGKVNFIDENDVFVGYDTHQDCCEYAGWFIAEKKTIFDSEKRTPKTPDVEEYVFDLGFFEKDSSPVYGSGGGVFFKLVALNKPDLYLHLFNVHNGYYSHGFTVEHDGKIIKSDYL